MYVKITNGVPTPYTIGQLRKDNPNTSFPKQVSAATLDRFHVYEVNDGVKPVFNPDTQKIVKGDITGNNATWTQEYLVADLSDDEIAAKENQRIVSINRERDKRVAELVVSSGGSRTYLLMQAVGLLHAKGNRPLNAGEQAKETDLLNAMAAIEAIYTKAQDAVDDLLTVDQITW